MTKMQKLDRFRKNLHQVLSGRGLRLVDVIAYDDQERGWMWFHVDAWETFKVGMRLKDGQFILEGRPMDNPGFSEKEMIIRIVANVQAWESFCKLHDSIDKTTQFILGHTRVVSHDGDKGPGVYRVEFDRPVYKVGGKVTDKHMDVIELGPKFATEYAVQYIRNAQPVKVTWLGTWEEVEKNYG